LNLKSEGALSVGFEKLQTIATVASCLFPSNVVQEGWSGKTAACPCEKWMGLGLIFIFAFLLVLWFDFFE
jgi:hypothetical protein